MKILKLSVLLFVVSLFSLFACNINNQDQNEFNGRRGVNPLNKLTLSNWTYQMVVEAFDWGPATTQLILNLEGNQVHNDKLSTSDFTVSVYHVGFGTMSSHQERPVIGVFASDSYGNPVTGYGSFITLKLGVHPQNGNPFTLTLAENGILGNRWSEPYEHTITFLGEEFMPKRTGRIIPIVDNFSTDHRFVGSDGVTLQYAYYQPEAEANRPLIIWLHGLGEGTFHDTAGSDIVLLGTRFTQLAAPEIQEIMEGAYILLPQASTRWLNSDGTGTHKYGLSYYEKTLIELIETFISENTNVDSNRIYLGGISNGGFMSIRLLLTRPDLFAGAIPVCLYFKPEDITDAEIKAIAHIPIWFVHDINDPTTPYTHSRSLYERLLATGASNVHFTVTEGIYDTSGLFFDTNGKPWRYDNHFSWIPVHNNEITDIIDGVELTIFEWLAIQTRHPEFHLHELYLTY